MMLRRSARILSLAIAVAIFVFVHYPAFAKMQRRYPCDPKFGYEGNYLEVNTGNITSPDDIQVCFQRENEPVTTGNKKWWEFWKAEIEAPAASDTTVCVKTSTLPGRFLINKGNWSSWQKQVSLNRKKTSFQFALCGSSEDLSVWEDFQRYNGVDSWDGMRIKALSNNGVMIEKVRVVQNRVRVLDNESTEEGWVNFLLRDDADGNDEISLAERIRKTKLNRINCLNLNEGPPYCEQSVPGLENTYDIPHVVITALLELGHSGSKKYHRENNAYCSEFAFYVIEKSVQLSNTCNSMIPNPGREDVNVKDMFRWFKMCERLIRREEIKEKIKAGDFLSVDNMGHSAIFLGWADPGKNFFWEISGNNRCHPERETFYAPKNKANMVCISKREFSKYILPEDFGGVVEY